MHPNTLITYDNLGQPREVARSFSSPILPNYKSTQSLSAPTPSPQRAMAHRLIATHIHSHWFVSQCAGEASLKVCSLLLLNSAKTAWDAEVGSSIEWVLWRSRLHICAPTCPCLQNKVKTFRNLVDTIGKWVHLAKSIRWYQKGSKSTAMINLECLGTVIRKMGKPRPISVHETSASTGSGEWCCQPGSLLAMEAHTFKLICWW